jgi:hypothetical protein
VGLVYIAAFASQVGESVGTLGASVAPAPMAAEIRPDREGYLKLTEAGVTDNFAQNVQAVEKSVLFAAQAPTAAAAALSAAVTAAAWKTKRSWYLVATDDRAIRPAFRERWRRSLRPQQLRSNRATWRCWRARRRQQNWSWRRLLDARAKPLVHVPDPRIHIIPAYEARRLISARMMCRLSVVALARSTSIAER